MSITIDKYRRSYLQGMLHALDIRKRKEKAAEFERRFVTKPSNTRSKP